MMSLTSKKAALQALPPRSAALPEMATAVLILNEAGEIEYVNGSARLLFAELNPIGCTMPALLASCGASGGETSVFPAEAGESPLRLRLADGRVLDGEARQLSSGGFVLSLDDVTDHVRSAELANLDVLTGLANRRVFYEQLVERVHATRSGGETAILFLDLDRFKAINDTLGHPIGDALLRKVAGRLKAAIGDKDVAARLGGDEFAILQSGAPQPSCAQTLAKRLVDLIGRTYVLEGHTLHVGASVGVTIAPRDGLDPDILLKNADLALYQAKASGRGTYQIYEPGMTERLQARRSLELDLRKALALKQFDLAYQPQIDLATGGVIGFEALIRWRRPGVGLVPPAEFIPIAEEIGIITAISEWVLRSACRQAATWPEHVAVAVNLSPVQFRSGKLTETVTSALAHSGLTSARLELEITEGVMLDGAESVLATLRALRELGARISMDDFGTGYSSLSYLQRFPLDKIKIDRSFIRGIDQQGERRAIVRAIATLASSLGMRTVAEGVETPGELDCVRAEGCDAVQGFLTGRPLTAQAATEFLVASRSRPIASEEGR